MRVRIKLMQGAPGRSVSECAQLMVESYHRERKQTPSDVDLEIHCDFNGNTMICREKSTAESIVKEFREGSKNKRNFSPTEKKISVIENKISELNCRILDIRFGDAVNKLRTLDFRNNSVIVDWLENYMRINVDAAAPRDRSMKKKIVRIFEIQGYRANMNTDNNFIEGDERNQLGYLVGQLLSGLKNHDIPHPMLLAFIGEFKEKFRQDYFVEK